jgi:hypothetical protein
MQFEVAVAGWVFNSYVTKEFVLGPHTIKVMCLQASSTDFDLTGQLIWPGAELLNNYLVQNFHILQGLSVIELGSGVGLTGLLCAHYCHHVVMTDHNATVLKACFNSITFSSHTHESGEKSHSTLWSFHKP